MIHVRRRVHEGEGENEVMRERAIEKIPAELRPSGEGAKGQILHPPPLHCHANLLARLIAMIFYTIS